MRTKQPHHAIPDMNAAGIISGRAKGNVGLGDPVEYVRAAGQRATLDQLAEMLWP